MDETIPVPVFVAVTVTPGINALLESETVPPRFAFVVCANVFVNRTGSSNAAITKSLFIKSSPTPFNTSRRRIAANCANYAN
jgi:hypothetical protein